jgi:hypothetical protein
MGKSAKKKGKTAAGPSSTTTVAPTLSSPADATDSTGVPDVEGTPVTSVSNTPPGSPGPEGRRVEESELNEIEVSYCSVMCVYAIVIISSVVTTMIHVFLFQSSL